MREIGEAIGLANTSAVRGHLRALEKKGYITKDPDKARSIRVVRSPSVLSRFKRKLHRFAGTDEGVLHRVVYGLGLATYRRRACFTGQRQSRLAEALDRRAVEHGWTFLDKRIEKDHVVLVVRVWPNHSPRLVVSRVRQAGEALRRRCPAEFPGRRMWARGCAVTTDLGELEEMVAQLLREAAGETGG
jgi:REP element-mobilizing transposase RayT